MNLQQIRYVVSIAEQGSFSKASQFLYITQPTLSNEVKKLENEIGIHIFHRGKKGIVITDEGREFLEYARCIMEQLLCLEHRYHSGMNQGLTFSVASQHVTCAAEAFMDLMNLYQNENYQMKLLEVKTKEALQYVCDGICQIGVLVRSKDNRVLELEISKRELEYYPIVLTRPHVYLYQGHPLARKAFLTKDDLEAYPFMIYDQGLDSWANFSEEVDVALDHQKTIVVTDRGAQISMSMYLNAYTIGSGIVGARASLPGMISIPYIDKRNCDVEVGWIKRKDQKMTAMLQQFVDRLYVAANATQQISEKAED